MNINKFTAITLFLLSGAASTTTQAASISYFLDLSNDLPDGINYAQVTISDSSTVAGDIDFTVEVLGPEFSVSPDANFGIQSFFFNYDMSLEVSSADIINISSPDWKTYENKNAGGGFGKFDFKLSGTGSTRTEVLSFSISCVDNDVPASYAIASSLHPSSGEYFAAHIAGFDTETYITSAKFAGSSPVPVPAAAWLFGSGLIGLIGIARRKII
jgi:hypothetical protein